MQTIRIREILEKTFPGLRDTPYEITSPPDRRYNCLAWAARDSNNWWWPSLKCSWPVPGKHEVSIASFLEAFTTLGYEVCENEDCEAGFEKIAIYVNLEGKPTHAARQLAQNRWTSKCGEFVDISHELRALNSRQYGKVAILMRKPAFSSQKELD